MRIFKNAWFVRFARARKINDEALSEAVMRVERGQVDADLGGGVVKQRIARPGQGKSKGYRTIILLRDTGRFSYTDLPKVNERTSVRTKKNSSKRWPGTSCFCPTPS